MNVIRAKLTQMTRDGRRRYRLGAAVLLALVLCVLAGAGASSVAVAGQTAVRDRVLSIDGFNHHLILVDLDANQETTIAPSFAFESAALSPDGTEIAANRIGHAGLVLINVDTKTMRRLTSGDDSDPTWSPDGAWIAFARGEGQSPLKGQGLFKIRRNGSGLHLIEGGFVSTPAWSPSGNVIAFDSWLVHGWDTTNHEWLHTTTSLEVVSASGHGLRHLTSHAWSRVRQGADDLDPMWAPSGALIAFQRTVGAGDSGGSSVYTIKPNGVGLRRITPSTYFAEPTGWSRDSGEVAGWESKICKACSSNGPIQAWVTNLTSGALSGFAKYASVMWSPTGKMVALGCGATADGACVVGQDGTVLQPVSLAAK